MNLKQSRRKNGRVYLSIEKAYRDSVTGKPKARTIKSLGYLDKLQEEYDDPISHFKALAAKMTEEENSLRYMSVNIDLNEKLPEMTEGLKNLGYSVPMKIYHDLSIHTFLKSKARKYGFEFNANSIMILLVISRMLSPCSKKKAFEERRRFFERFDFSLDDVYRALTFFNKVGADLQRYIHAKIAEKYGSDTSVIYYDVTNYYFEKKADDLVKYGRPKQNRKKPVVQLGLAMDRDGIPLHYEIFRGNILDKETFRSVIGEVRRNYDTGRIVVVADMGIITGDNISYLIGEHPDRPLNGYVFSFSVRGATNKFKEYVLDEEGYRDRNGKPSTPDSDFKIKSRRIKRDINVTKGDGSTGKKSVGEKQIVFWSRKYFLKARAEREEVLSKARDLIANPRKYTKATSYGAAAFVNHLEFDKKTGEVLEAGINLTLDEAKIANEEMLDGYYSIVTSEMEMADGDIIDTYKGLWEIEETFKITKSDLAARPVFVKEHDHINAHFLTCFIALTVLRLIQKQTSKQFSAAEVINCLNHIECMNETENIYLFGFRNDISEVLGDTFDIDFSRKRLTLAEIKKILGDVKK
jgi:hypothetical protein